jgi:EAL domain-containing protein (putative c-di-GMP-specific phosphodiesterase class I)
MPGTVARVDICWPSGFPFLLYAQPIVTLSGQLTGAELLVRARARHGQAGGASEVLGHARRWLAQLQLDRLVLAAAGQLARQSPAPFFWSANLAPVTVAHVQRRGLIPPERVWWEISEQVHPDQVSSGWLRRCPGAGGAVAVDDLTSTDQARRWVRAGAQVLKIDASVGSRPR